jgi:hypothetical protein
VYFFCRRKAAFFLTLFIPGTQGGLIMVATAAPGGMAQVEAEAPGNDIYSSIAAAQ